MASSVGICWDDMYSAQWLNRRDPISRTFSLFSKVPIQKNWMRAAKTGKILWCIFRVFLRFWGWRPEYIIIAEERKFAQWNVYCAWREVCLLGCSDGDSLVLVLTLYVCLTWICLTHRTSPVKQDGGYSIQELPVCILWKAENQACIYRETFQARII